MSVPKKRPDAAEIAPSDDMHAPRPLTIAENIVLTLKVLAGLGLLGGTLWAAKLWTAAT
jgi:hypothetical protein